MTDKEFVHRLKERDNDRDLHVNDIMVIVATTADGFWIMHQEDIGVNNPEAKIYDCHLLEVS